MSPISPTQCQSCDFVQLPQLVSNGNNLNIDTADTLLEVISYA